MLRVVGLWFLLLGLFACNETAEKEASIKMEETEGANEIVEEDASLDSLAQIKVEELGIGIYKRLNNDNCVAFLEEYGAEHGENLVRMETDFGDILVRLYEDTPIHRASFLYLIERNYFAPTQIVRVVPGFVIQGGNSEELEDQEQRFLIGKYTLPNEIKRQHIHKRGALAMSRSYENNPDKRSAPYDFYLVQGQKVSDAGLFQAEKKNGYSYSDEEKAIYKKAGGAPHLDGEHTVIGEIIQGWDVVDKIAKVPTDDGEWPVKEVTVNMSVAAE